MDREKKEKMKVKFNVFKYLIILLTISLLALILSGFQYFLMQYGDEYKTILYTSQMEDEFMQGNVNMPMPIYDKPTQELIDSTYNQSMENFATTIKNNYVYNQMYDCKYWSYAWAKWWTYKKDELNLKMKYVTTDNHIFVMVYNESGYCTLENKIVDCYWT